MLLVWERHKVLCLVVFIEHAQYNSFAIIFITYDTMMYELVCQIMRICQTNLVYSYSNKQCR